MDSDEESIETTAVFNLAIKDGDQHLEFLQTLMQAVMNKEVVENCMTKELNENSSVFAGTVRMTYIGDIYEKEKYRNS